MPSLIRKSKKLDKPGLFVLGLLIAIVAALAAPAAGVAAPDGPEPEPPAPPQLSFEPDHYDFGLQPLNWGSAQTTFNLRNTGTEAFQIGSPQISGPGSSAFWTGNSNCYGSVLQPGETCYAQIYFGPNDAFEFDAQFSVNVDSYSFSADLSGTGGRAVLTPASSPADFGVAKVGSDGVTREVTIANTGNIPGGAFIAVIAGGAIGSFQLLDENCTGVPLAPAATCTLQIRFRPLSEGVKKATLGLFGDSDGGTQVVLTGVGAAADLPPVAASAPGAVSAQTAAGPRPKRGKRKHGIRRHPRRANLKVARQVLAAHTEQRKR